MLGRPRRRAGAPRSASRSSRSCSPSNPPYLDFIRNDPLGLREVTARFFFKQASGTGGCSRPTGCGCRCCCSRPAATRSSTARRVRQWFDAAPRAGQALRPVPRVRPHPRLRGGPRRRYWDDLVRVARRGRGADGSSAFVAAPPRRAAVDVLTVELPFRFSFGHALAARSSSTNVVTRVALDDGTVGYGEGVPREYVTGETVESARRGADRALVPALLGSTRGDAGRASPAADRRGRAADRSRRHARRRPRAARSSSALLDAVRPALRLLGAAPGSAPSPRAAVRYDAVMPFVEPAEARRRSRVLIRRSASSR